MRRYELNNQYSDYIFQIVFVLHMVLVTLLLVNMLIAMMGNTYTLVSQTQKEYLRQVN